MNKYTYTQGRFTFKRVSKRTARRCYNNGLPVILCPVNLRPGSPWHCETEFRRNGESFNMRVDVFEHYNATNSETGRYSAFYIPVRTVDRFTGETPTADTLGTVEQYDYSYISQ